MGEALGPISALDDSNRRTEMFQQLISMSTAEDAPWETCTGNTALTIFPLLSFSHEKKKVGEKSKE